MCVLRSSSPSEIGLVGLRSFCLYARQRSFRGLLLPLFLLLGLPDLSHLRLDGFLVLIALLVHPLRVRVSLDPAFAEVAPVRLALLRDGILVPHILVIHDAQGRTRDDLELLSSPRARYSPSRCLLAGEYKAARQTFWCPENKAEQ